MPINHHMIRFTFVHLFKVIICPSNYSLIYAYSPTVGEYCAIANRDKAYLNARAMHSALGEKSIVIVVRCDRGAFMALKRAFLLAKDIKDAGLGIFVYLDHEGVRE